VPIFVSEDGLKGVAEDAAIGGISGAAGIYIFEKLLSFIGNTVSKWVPAQYVNVVTSYIYALILEYIGEKYSGSETVKKAIQVAGFTPFAKYLGILAGDGPPVTTNTPSGAPAYVSKWSTLEAIPL